MKKFIKWLFQTLPQEAPKEESKGFCVCCKQTKPLVVSGCCENCFAKAFTYNGPGAY